MLVAGWPGEIECTEAEVAVTLVAALGGGGCEGGLTTNPPFLLKWQAFGVQLLSAAAVLLHSHPSTSGVFLRCRSAPCLLPSFLPSGSS